MKNLLPFMTKKKKKNLLKQNRYRQWESTRMWKRDKTKFFHLFFSLMTSFKNCCCVFSFSRIQFFFLKFYITPKKKSNASTAKQPTESIFFSYIIIHSRKWWKKERIKKRKNKKQKKLHKKQKDWYNTYK